MENEKNLNHTAHIKFQQIEKRYTFSMAVMQSPQKGLKEVFTQVEKMKAWHVFFLFKGVKSLTMPIDEHNSLRF